MNFNWYRLKVSTNQWNNYYSKISSYTFLEEGGTDTWVGFLSVIPPENCLEITNMEDLMKIQRHREGTNTYPQPFEKIK